MYLAIIFSSVTPLALNTNKMKTIERLNWKIDDIVPGPSIDCICYNDTPQKQLCSWYIDSYNIDMTKIEINRLNPRNKVSYHSVWFPCETPDNFSLTKKRKTYEAICRVPQSLHNTSRIMKRFIGGCPGGLVSSWQIRHPTIRLQQGATMLQFRS